MTETTTDATTDEIPFFPAPVPPVFTDPAAVRALLGPVLESLAAVVEVERDRHERPTPCREFTVSQLRDHVLGWLQHFAAALGDPDRTRPRPDADAYRAAADDRSPGAVVRESAAALDAAVASGVLGRRVVMSASRMDGDAAAAMVLGEYLVHGWDLAVATGSPWDPSPQACEAALAFFEGIVTDEYRGSGGFFDALVEVPEDAPPLARLLGFAGRDPRWAPPTP